jgi:hypothetical protein
MSASADLIRHATTACEPIRRIAVEASRAQGALALTYRIEGEIPRLAIPVAGPSQRADDLWKQSCFEAFLQADGGGGYLEFNFSPSGNWAAYRFAGRRRGRESPELMAPRMEVRRGPDWLAMHIQLLLTGIAEFAHDKPVSAGLTAVIEDEHGGLSYWALAHGAAQPDFHDPATFTLRMPA